LDFFVFVVFESKHGKDGVDRGSIEAVGADLIGGVLVDAQLLLQHLYFEKSVLIDATEVDPCDEIVFIGNALERAVEQEEVAWLDAGLLAFKNL